MRTFTGEHFCVSGVAKCTLVGASCIHVSFGSRASGTRQYILAKELSLDLCLIQVEIRTTSSFLSNRNDYLGLKVSFLTVWVDATSRSHARTKPIKDSYHLGSDRTANGACTDEMKQLRRNARLDLRITFPLNRRCQTEELTGDLQQQQRRQRTLSLQTHTEHVKLLSLQFLASFSAHSPQGRLRRLVWPNP